MALLTMTPLMQFLLNTKIMEKMQTWEILEKVPVYLDHVNVNLVLKELPLWQKWQKKQRNSNSAGFNSERILKLFTS